MRKLLGAVFAACLVIISGSTAVSALSINGPHPPGPQINGWFKDSLTASLSDRCNGNGSNSNPYSFDYSSNNSGTHTYYFYVDDNENPYVSVDSDGSGYTPLDNQPCGFSLKYLIGYKITKAGQFTASIDSQAPSIGITQPTGNTTTTASTFAVSGVVSDPENNLSSVKAIINGATSATVSVSGNTFRVTVSLRNGSNSVQMVATDGVGHSTSSNTVTITKAVAASGSGSSPNTSSTDTGAPPSTNQSSDVQFSPQQVININDPYADQANADPSNVQAASSLAGVTGPAYIWLIILLIILAGACLFVLNKFYPIFSMLKKSRAGLRRRIVIVVALPSIIPLLGIGVLGYQQLGDIVKNSLSDQLNNASRTSALKLQREFGIRNIVITKTASDILQIQNQYKAQADQLAQQKNNCLQVVNANIPAGRYSNVTSNTDCLPFLTGFAQIANVSTKVSDYITALNKGADYANNNIVSDEDGRVNELLGSLRDYFPDVSEIDIVDATKQANLKAILPKIDQNQPAISDSGKDLLAVASSKKVIEVKTTDKAQQLLLTYPVISGKKVLGGVVVAIDTGHFSFIPSIWESTPKPYSTDQVFFVTTAGDIIAPRSSSDKQFQDQIKPLAATPADKVFNLTFNGQMLATRTAAVPNTNFVVAVGAPANSILAPLAGIQTTAILAIVGFILVSILLAIWFVSGIASALEKLYFGAQNYSKGDLDYHIDVGTNDELQVLGDTMNQMAADIKEAQAALVQKDKDFINVATHELRAPITAIIGFLSMVTEDGMGSVDEKAHKLIDQAYGGAKRLREIINDMLDIARLESGHSEFDLKPLDIHELTQSIVDMQSIVAQQAGLTLTYEPAKDIPQVTADKNKLQIILTNFISNAIKYNRPKGTITVAHEIDGDKLVTSVSDTGLGIPDDQKAHMFEKFYRVQDEDRAKVPGTGLGLHITKRFIEAMDGKVWFESTHGKGTTFYFSLPLAGRSGKLEPQDPDPVVPGSN